MFLSAGCSTLVQLEHAIIRDDTEKAKQLIVDDKKDIDKKNSAGKTALILATIWSREEVVRAILAAGADPNITNNRGSSALHEAAFKGIPSLVNLLLEHGAKVNLSTNRNKTPLYFATLNQFYPVIKQLIQKGADVNYPDVDGRTPLFIACTGGYTSVVEYLLLHDANPNIKDREGRTPLMDAVSGNHKKIVRLLIQHGADIDALSSDQQTARNIAEENGNVSLVELLGNNTYKNIVSGYKSNQNNIVLSTINGQVNGKQLVPSSLRSWELRTAQGRFLDMLSETNLFSSVDVSDEHNIDKKTIYATLNVEEKEDKHTGSNAGKAFLVGFFTLGLAPTSANYSYASKMTLVVERFDGEKRKYSATADTSSNWVGDPRTQNYAIKAGNAKNIARRVVTQQVFESLISQIETNHNFFETP